MDRWLWGQASLPFLRGGVSRSSLSDTRPLTANEKDPSAPLEMTIREEHFSSAHFIRYSRYPSPTLSFRAQREIFLALRAFLLPSQKHSHFPYHTYDIIPFCKKDPSTSLGMTLCEYRSLTLPIYFPCNNDTREAPSTFAALLFFMRRTTPLNPTT